MIPYERHELIIRHLTQHGLAKIAELQEAIPEVSASTLRRDLKELERLGRVEHLAGGAVKLLTAAHEVSVTAKDTLQSAEKDAIAARAAELVNDGDTIYLDSGTTCAALLRALLDRPVTIYTTNGMACFVKAQTRAEIIVIGGQFNPVTSSLAGPLTEAMLRELYFDKAFIGINAVDEERGFMTPGYLEATKKRIVRDNANEVYVLCDSSKFHGFSNVRVFGFDGVEIVTDKADEKLARCARLIVA